MFSYFITNGNAERKKEREREREREREILNFKFLMNKEMLR
jgi:hypothetical protein